jgi:hypothetical protein
MIDEIKSKMAHTQHSFSACHEPAIVCKGHGQKVARQIQWPVSWRFQSPSKLRQRPRLGETPAEWHNRVPSKERKAETGKIGPIAER